MKAYVNEDCIGCGAIGEVPAEFEEAAKEACTGCPVGAIELS